MERQLLLLGILRAQKAHGYQLNAFLENRWDFITDLKPSTAYHILDQMAADGFVAVDFEQVGNRPRRKVYEITPEGEEHFHHLLRANLRDHGTVAYPDEVGLAYMVELPHDDIGRLLEEKRQRIASELERLVEIESTLKASNAGSVYMALDHHMTLVRADLEWLERLIGQLAEGARTKGPGQ